MITTHNDYYAQGLHQTLITTHTSVFVRFIVSIQVSIPNVSEGFLPIIVSQMMSRESIVIGLLIIRCLVYMHINVMMMHMVLHYH